MPIKFRTIKSSDSAEYKFAESLLVDTFPRDEYRDLDALRRIIAEEPAYHLLAVTDEGQPVGLVGYWELEDFIYVEHLATHPLMRNGGYGSRILEALKQPAKGIVLEVEPPTDEITQRRIGFYQRQGFTLCEKEYTQPAYRKGGKQLPLLLMSYNYNLQREFERVKAIIHKYVYGVE